MYFTAHTQKSCEMTDLLIKLIMVIILQYIYISNHHIVHFKYITFLVNDTPIKACLVFSW